MEAKHPIEQFFSPHHPVTAYLKMKFLGLTDNVLTIGMEGPESFVVDAATGELHSGFATLALDTVLGGMVLGQIKMLQPIATVGLTVQHMRRAVRGEKLVCVGHMEGIHHDMAYLSGHLKTAEAGEVLSTATGTFMIGTRAKPLGARL